jgi:pimeloyl-ACP methyl ester carboxylesterase
MSIAVRSHVRFVRDADLHWEEYVVPGARRDRRPVVLLHGLSDSCRTWNLVAPALAARRRVLALDLPGHGRSARPDAPYDAAYYARTVSAWLEALRRDDPSLDAFDVVGHSLGGGVAQRLLLESAGARMQRLALVSAGGLGTEVALPLRIAAVTGAIEITGQLLMGVGTRAGIRVLGGNFGPDERRHLATVNARPGTARALGRTLRSVVDLRGQREHLLDHAHRLARLPPLRVFWGDRDNVIPVAHAEAALRAIDGIRVHRFPRVGHYPHREAVSDFVPALISFLDEPQPQPRIRHGARSPRAAEPQAVLGVLRVGRLAQAGG